MPEKLWLYGGAGLLALISLLIKAFGIPNILAPYPLPFLIVIFSGGKYVFPFITPILYIFVLKLFSNSKHFAKMIIILILGFAILNYIFFQNAWDLGVKYQSLQYAQFVAMENIIGFLLALTLAVMGHIKKSRRLVLSANLVLFALLSWCAFPYLGEVL